MGDAGESYSNGTQYVCRFSGCFTDIRQIDEYSYSLTLSEPDSDYQEGLEPCGLYNVELGYGFFG